MKDKRKKFKRTQSQSLEINESLDENNDKTPTSRKKQENDAKFALFGMEENDLKDIEEIEPEILNPYSRLYHIPKSEIEIIPSSKRPQTGNLEKQSRNSRLQDIHEKYKQSKKSNDREYVTKYQSTNSYKNQQGGSDIVNINFEDMTEEGENLKECKRLLEIDRQAKRIFSGNNKMTSNNFRVQGHEKSNYHNLDNEISILNRPNSSATKIIKGTVCKSDFYNTEYSTYKPLNQKSSPSFLKNVDNNQYIQNSPQNPIQYIKNKDKYPTTVKSSLLLNKKRTRTLQRSQNEGTYKNPVYNDSTKIINNINNQQFYKQKSPRPVSHFVTYSQNVKNMYQELNNKTKNDEETQKNIAYIKENVSHLEDQVFSESDIIPNPKNNQKINQAIINKYTTSGRMNFNLHEELPPDMIGNILKIDLYRQLEKKNMKNSSLDKAKSHDNSFKIERRRLLSSNSIDNMNRNNATAIILQDPKDLQINTPIIQNPYDELNLYNSNSKLSKIVSDASTSYFKTYQSQNKNYNIIQKKPLNSKSYFSSHRDTTPANKTFAFRDSNKYSLERKQNIFIKGTDNSQKTIRKVLWQNDLKKKIHAEQIGYKISNKSSNRPQTSSSRMILKDFNTIHKNTKKMISGKTTRDFNDKVITEMVVLSKELKPMNGSKITLTLENKLKEKSTYKNYKSGMKS